LDDGFLGGLLDAVPGAMRQLSKLPLDRVYLACTSAAFTNPERVRQLAVEAAAAMPAPIVTAFDALVSALRRIGARRIVLAAPYPEEITRAEADQFTMCGIVVTGLAALGADDGYAAIAPGEIRALLANIGQDALEAAEATVLSCTGWPTHSVVTELRHRLRMPIISSNLAIATHARADRRTRS
jgi:maleate isomerase